MAPVPKSPVERAHEALAVLERRGGARALPAVLTSGDVKPLMGRTWFHEVLRRGELPGVQVVAYGVWRCERETFVEWLREASHEWHTAA
jgi:hypothetical protein